MYRQKNCLQMYIGRKAICKIVKAEKPHNIVLRQKKPFANIYRQERPLQMYMDRKALSNVLRQKSP